MSVIKEYWRTSAIIIALIVILALLVYTPPPSERSRIVSNPPDQKTIAGFVLPPKNGTCYLSVGLIYHEGSKDIGKDVGDQIDAFSTMVGKNHTVYFDVWADMWDPKEIYWQLDTYRPLLEDGKLKALGLTIWPTVKANSYLDNYTVKQIANGSQDAFIIQQAKDVKSFGYPLFIRFGAEFNIYQGKAYEGQPQNTAYRFAENPTDFVNAWRHYVDVFRAQNVSNAIFMWNPNFADFGDHHYTEYYPGDSYVDWVGIDLYQYTNTSDPASMIMGVYNEYSDQKPIAIAEWGTDWPNLHISDSDRARFVGALFDAVASLPQVRLVDYWYYQDFKFDATNQPQTTAMYSQKASDPRYI